MLLQFSPTSKNVSALMLKDSLIWFNLKKFFVLLNLRNLYRKILWRISLKIPRILEKESYFVSRVSRILDIKKKTKFSQNRRKSYVSKTIQLYKKILWVFLKYKENQKRLSISTFALPFLVFEIDRYKQLKKKK